MDIKSTLATQSLNLGRISTETEGAKPDASGLAGQLAQDFADTLRAAEQTADSALTGGADPHALVEALAQSQLAVETVVAIRDKVVEAYQEVMRMPV